MAEVDFVVHKAQERSLTFVAPYAYPLLVENGGFGSGGAERQFFLFARALKKRGWRVSFITADPSDSGDTHSTIFPIYYAKFSYLGGSKVLMPFDWVSLWRAMAKANACYYLLKVPGHLLAPMGFFCKIHKRKLVFWTQMTFDANPQERGDMNKVASWLQDWGLKRADVVIAQSEDQKKGFKNNYRINAKIVPSICDSLLPNSNAEANSHDPGKEVDILWVGNPKPKKRHEVFFELAKFLPHRRFAIAMNNNDTQRFEQARENAKKLPNVKFLGTVPPIEMEIWFRKTKLFLNTSICEGFPNTFLQAWMNAIPVVSLNIDPDNIIKSNCLGYIIEQRRYVTARYVEQAQDMIESVENLLKNEILRIQMGKNAVAWVTQNHAPDVVVPRLIRVLQKVSSRKTLKF